MKAAEAPLPSSNEIALAKVSSRALSAFLETRADVQDVSITDANGAAHAMTLPVSALRLLVDILTELGEGNTVKLVPIQAELTTQEGADLLNMSRPTFIKLLDEGCIPFSYTGNRRKVKYADVRAYQAQLKRDRLASLKTLTELDQELGLGYE